MSKDRYTELNTVILHESINEIDNEEDENITLLLAHRAEYVDAYGELRKYRFCIYGTCTWWTI